MRGYEHVIRGTGRSGCSFVVKRAGGIVLEEREVARKDHQQPWTILCAYNKLNGEFCSEHKWLFQNVIRESWGFDGLVLTDWHATADRVAGLLAGIDLEMPGSGTSHHAEILDALAEEEELESDGPLKWTPSVRKSINEAVAHNLKLAFRTSTPPQPGKAAVDSLGNAAENGIMHEAGEPYSATLDAHHELAYRVARDCTVLLKNEDNILPLDRDQTPSIAVIGAFAKTCPRFQGMGSSQVNPHKIDTLWSSLKSQDPSSKTKLLYAQGYDAYEVEEDNKHVIDETLVEEAVRVAQQATVSILMIGLPGGYESEAIDRTSLDLPAQHNALVEAICGSNNAHNDAANRNTIVILCNGGIVTMPWVRGPKAIMEGFLPGQGGGRALVDLLFGVVSPSAKLAATIPVAMQDIPANLNFPGSGNSVEYREGLNVGYRYFCSTSPSVPVLYSFGHGLSYADFDYHTSDKLTVTVEQDEPLAKQVSIRFPLTHREKSSFRVPSSEVVQCYVHFDANGGSTVYRPELELKEFLKTPLLSPGETCWITMRLTTEAFSFWDVGVNDWVVEPGSYKVRIGASCSDIRLEATIQFDTGRSASPQAREASQNVQTSNPATAGINETSNPPVADDATFSRMLVGQEFPNQGNCQTNQWDRRGRSRLVLDRNSLLQDAAAVSIIGAGLARFAWRRACENLEAGTKLPADAAREDGVDAQLQSGNPIMLQRVAFAVVQNMPLRGFTLLTDGKLSFEVLDILIAMANGFYLLALRLIFFGKPRQRRWTPSMNGSK